MDAFYASVEVRDRPELEGKPVLVGGSPRGRGVVAAASYEARQFGIHSAMPASRAKRLCPHAIFLKPRHDYYAEISRQIRDILDRYTPLVEPLALDEAFLDVTASRNLWGEGPDIGHAIKHEIREELGLVASVGVAANKFLAKLASDFDKPDGFVVIPPEHVQDFLDPLPISRLWGVGKSTDRVLTELGIATIAQLRGLPQQILKQRLGAWGHHFWQLAHGIDSRPVVHDREAKSISHETTFERDIDDVDIGTRQKDCWLKHYRIHLLQSVYWVSESARLIMTSTRSSNFSRISPRKSNRIWIVLLIKSRIGLGSGRSTEVGGRGIEILYAYSRFVLIAPSMSKYR